MKNLRIMEKLSIKKELLDELLKSWKSSTWYYVGHFKNYSEVVRKAEKHPAAFATVDAKDRIYVLTGEEWNNSKNVRWRRCEVRE